MQSDDLFYPLPVLENMEIPDQRPGGWKSYMGSQDYAFKKCCKKYKKGKRCRKCPDR